MPYIPKKVLPKIVENTTSYTDLNWLVNKSGANAVQNIGSVIGLLKAHPEIQTISQVEDAINFHYANKCSCGCKFVANIDIFKQNIANFCGEKWAEWIEDAQGYGLNMLTEKSLNGHKAEQQLLVKLRKMFPSLEIHTTKAENDLKYAVDVYIFDSKKQILGIQLKPMSWDEREDVKNKIKMEAFKKDSTAIKGMKESHAVIVRYNISQIHNHITINFNQLEQKIKEVFHV